jgi:hypothetical protein
LASFGPSSPAAHGRSCCKKPDEVTETIGRTGTIGNLREFTLRDGEYAATELVEVAADGARREGLTMKGANGGHG